MCDVVCVVFLCVSVIVRAPLFSVLVCCCVLVVCVFCCVCMCLNVIVYAVCDLLCDIVWFGFC